MAVVPVPDRARLVTESMAVLEMEIEPLKVPAAFGANTTLRGTLWPAAMITGRLGELRLKYLVETATLLMVTAAEPEFVAVVDIVLLLPAFTLPKLRDGLVREIVPLWDEFEEPVLRPWQAVKIHSAPSRSREAIIFEQTFPPVRPPLASGRKSLTRGGLHIVSSIGQED